MHSSLDSFVAGPKGEIDWIKVDEEMFEYSGRQTDQSDTGLYGRVTYQMMDAYWPTAGDDPNASKHDTQHSAWYNHVSKVVISKTMKGKLIPNTTIISENISEEITKLKQKPGKDIVVFGSPSIGHLLLSYNLIDDMWVFINPVLIGKGIPLFKDIKEIKKLKLIDSKVFNSGVVGLLYEKYK